MDFLCSFRPLSSTPAGRRAVETFGLAPFVDGSCRREPDLEQPFPSISALCRTSRFAPRLQPGDRVVYVTTKGAHGDLLPRHWRIVAALQVLVRFEGHEKAAAWYRSMGLALPSNCMVEENPPLALERTLGLPRGIQMCASTAPAPRRGCRPRATVFDPLAAWDALYRERARANPVFLACEPLFLELHEPPVLSEEGVREVFERGAMPCTQTPPRLSERELESLLQLARSWPHLSRRDAQPARRRA